MLTRQDARYDAYATSLDVLAAFIRSSPPTSSLTVTTSSPSFGLGHGTPTQPIDTVYAVDELRMLLGNVC